MTKTSSKFLAACVVLAMFGSAQAADNLSKGARADGSSKGEGSSYGAVIDGDAATAWTPAGDAGESVCVKWDSSKTVGAVVIKEIGDNVTAWRVEDRNGSKVKALAEGMTLGSAATAEFEPLSSKKICVVVVSAKGKPAIAELETYASKP